MQEEVKGKSPKEGVMKNNYVSTSKWEEALSNIQSQNEHTDYMATQGSYF